MYVSNHYLAMFYVSLNVLLGFLSFKTAESTPTIRFIISNYGIEL